FPESLVPYGQEGIRSNIQSVIDAVSLDNPFPAAHFPEMAWNQLVLKALFNGRPIYRIQGLEERANPALAKALSNYAHERWAASRWVSPELWRSCQSFLDETIVADLKKVASDEAPGQKEAVALIAYHSTCPEKGELVAHLEPFREAIEEGALNWDGLGVELEEAGG
ncbi:MAG: EboA domain-containing protein, partial [Verrucomicrobiota bacterium]